MSQTTKQAIAASMRKLLRQKPLSKITVTDIAEDCGVSRMTFYYHFKDIYDLVEWTLNESAAQVLEQCKYTGSGEQILPAILCALQENKLELTNLLRSVRREEADYYLHKMIYGVLDGRLSSQAPQLAAAPEDRTFVLDFYTCASTGILLTWIQGGMKTDPRLLADQLTAIISIENVLAALDSLRQSRARRRGPA